MTPTIIFRDERLVDLVFTLNLNSIEQAIKATKNRLEGRNQRGRPRRLSAQQVAEILVLLREGKILKKDIAARYSVTPPTITKISKGVYLTNADQIEI
ncbi:helix-turn-helix domain-containing protein [Aquipseudomonas guryensis]|uniref:Resolvase HTH domain-containing protein n=1 Tax=Aquipseudomonas guryensis TaxID=2759165 RepID=A0A7W4DBF1_9GAMM|nr:helix-turn-helix domain-containing protein [Pseudomonas guryensis]MBB1519470.1 hypothetical protein [Pseudomonas guryensis]